MAIRKRSRVVWFLLIVVAGLVGICVLLAAGLALVNARAPKALNRPDRLNAEDVILLAEAQHLREQLGEQVWPGWSQADIPAALIHGERVFVLGMDRPSPGWIKPPGNRQFGGDWLMLEGCGLHAETCYFQPYANADIDLGNFTVIVGERWVLSMQTREWAAIRFRKGFAEELPPFLRAVFPYGLAQQVLLGGAELYVPMLLHEAFHAYQGSQVPERLNQAERAVRLEDSYPWQDQQSQSAWKDERDLLWQAAHAQTDSEAAGLVASFLARRDQRRQQTGLSAELVDFERQREWLEGLAKYAELSAGRLAAETAGYTPLPETGRVRDFKGYAPYTRFYKQQVDQVKLLLSNNETVFYYTGMAQAVLLDRLMPGWKSRAFEPGVYLEDLLREAVGG